MAIGAEDLEIDQGASWSIGWQYDPTATGDGIDLTTGWVGRCQVRPRHGSDVVLVAFHSDPTKEWPGTVGLGSDGTVVLGLTPDVTEALSWRGLAVYDVELEAPDGNVVRLVEGTIRLSREATTDE